MLEWRGKDSFAAEAASFGEIDIRARAEVMPVALSARIVAAPASFALPMVQRKVFKPPFTVRPPAAGAGRPTVMHPKLQPRSVGHMN